MKDRIDTSCTKKKFIRKVHAGYYTRRRAESSYSVRSYSIVEGAVLCLALNLIVIVEFDRLRSFLSEFPRIMAAYRQSWPIAKPVSCSTATVCQLDLPDLPDRPYHPDAKVVFPKRAFGQKKQVFCGAQHQWFTQWPFLHYDKGKDVVFCHTCVNAFRLGRILSSKNASTAFVSDIDQCVMD